MLSCCCQAHRAEPGREWPCTRWCNGKHLLSAHFFQVLVELFINSRCAELTRHLEMHAAGKLLSHATLERLPFSCLRVGSLRAEGTNCVCPNHTYLRAGFEHVQPGRGTLHQDPCQLPASPCMSQQGFLPWHCQHKLFCCNSCRAAAWKEALLTRNGKAGSSGLHHTCKQPAGARRATGIMGKRNCSWKASSLACRRN